MVEEREREVCERREKNVSWSRWSDEICTFRTDDGWRSPKPVAVAGCIAKKKKKKTKVVSRNANSKVGNSAWPDFLFFWQRKSRIHSTLGPTIISSTYNPHTRLHQMFWNENKRHGRVLVMGIMQRSVVVVLWQWECPTLWQYGYLIGEQPTLYVILSIYWQTMYSVWFSNTQ